MASRPIRRGGPPYPAWLVLVATTATGCALPGPALTQQNCAIRAAARPILALDPDAVWCEAYNRLIALGPASLEYLMRQRAMTQPAAPGDLGVLLHTSLIRLLADPGSSPPRLSASCLETTLGVLHFDVKVQGHRLGTVGVPSGMVPTTWLDLYPADFDQPLAMMIDVEGDRRALLEWWSVQRSSAPLSRHPVLPQATHLWRLLARRYADRWEYHPDPRAILCAAPPRGAALLDVPTTDYNLVRAACIWLGSCGDGPVQDRLVDLVGDASPVVAYNARFALRYSPDERIRQAILRTVPR